MAALLATAMFLFAMCLSSLPIVSAAGWFTFTTPPREQLLRFAGYSPTTVSANPLQYDSGGQRFDVGIMYEPLFGQNIAPTDPTKQLIP